MEGPQKVVKEYKNGVHMEASDKWEGASVGRTNEPRIVLTWHEDGNLKSEETLVGNKEHGLSTEFHENGREKSRVTMRNDLKEGRYLEWFEDGLLEADGNYGLGKREGYWYEYDPSGEVVREGTYVANKANGAWKEWYRYERMKNGMLREYQYKDGVRHGKSVEWDTDGRKVSEGEYKNGKMDGEWTYHFKGGVRKVIYENGEYKQEKR
jgi:antitoxin component YwqK of YwqJK toxin-antitoxin module